MPERCPEVEQVVREWLDAKQAGHGEAISAGLSEYRDALAIGTDASEWWAGAEAATGAHVVGGAFSAVLEHVEAHRHGEVACAAVRARVETGEPGGMPIRLTLVLVREGDRRWRIVQSHASVPDAG